MKPSSAKAKGRNLQKRVRDALLATYPHLTDRDVRSTSMGAGGVDVLLSALAVRQFPYSVECKRRARMAVFDLWKDTLDNVAVGTNPLLVIQQDRSDPLVVIDLQHFLELQRESSGSNRAAGESVPSEHELLRARDGSDRERRAKVPASTRTDADPENSGRHPQRTVAKRGTSKE